MSRILCLGEALIDLIAPEPVTRPELASSYEVRCGGALANVAVAASRAGARGALAGGVGDDPWGRLLRERLEREGVDVSELATLEGIETPYAFATFDPSGEASFRVYGDTIEAGIEALATRAPSLAEGSAAVVFGSNTLVAAAEREVTMRFLDGARERGVPILFDPNLRPNRWSDLDTARELILSVANGVRLLKTNLDEAHWLLGDEGLEPERAARGLLGLGAELAVVTAGPAGAFASGIAEARAAAPEVRVRSPLGAGDAAMGTLAAALALGAWRPEAIAPAVEAAVAAGARACEHLGGID